MAAALALLGASTPAIAQGYPAGPVRIVVPPPAGGGVSGTGRLRGEFAKWARVIKLAGAR